MKRTRIIVVVAILVPLLWCFGSALFSARSFAFRDSAHYYYPLFKWTADEWGEGRVPLWNPQENAGVPAVADSTSSVFYPGKLIFALPVSFAWRFKLYVVGHVLLAAAGTFWVARGWQASPTAAGIAAVSYAFGGNVLFQYCNVVFLVGAAWLPLAVLAAERMLVQRKMGGALALGAVLALMVLGGDPQAAYHAGLLAALYALILWRVDRRKRSPGEPLSQHASRWPRRLATHRFTLLAVAALAAALLAAIQIIPSLQWSRQSTRAAFARPRSIHEIPRYLTRDEAAWSEVRKGLFDQPVASHHDHIYQFSVGPWRAAEFVWPNFSGRMFPRHQRWTQAIPGEDRAWTPSMYMGLLPLLLALGGWKLRAGDARQRWLSWMVLFGLLGSLGFYGLGWLVQEVRHGLGADANDVVMGQPVGGLYWFLVVLLPGYAYFRYPAKLMVVAALGLSLLAARRWDKAFETQATRLPRVLLAVGGLSLLGAAFLHLAASRGWWAAWTESVPGDDLYGPFHAPGAAHDVTFGLLQTCLVSFAVLLLWRCRAKVPTAILSQLALLITAVDLAMANGWMVATAADQIWEQEPRAAVAMRRADQDGQRRYRVLREPQEFWLPSRWSAAGSDQRVVEGLQLDYDTLFPRYHLLADVSVVETPLSITSLDYDVALYLARNFNAPERQDWQRDFFRAMSVKYILMPDQTPDASNVNLWQVADSYRRAWLVDSIEVLPPLRDSSPTAVVARTKQALFPNQSLRDFAHTAVIEADATPGNFETSRTLRDWSCRIVVDEPQRVEIEVESDQPGFLVLNDFYQPDWTAELIGGDKSPQPLEVYRTNRIMRGVALPAGDHRVVFRYRPRGFWIGAVVSCVAWLSLLAVFVRQCKRQDPSRT